MKLPHCPLGRDREREPYFLVDEEEDITTRVHARRPKNVNAKHVRTGLWTRLERPERLVGKRDENDDILEAPAKVIAERLDLSLQDRLTEAV